METSKIVQALAEYPAATLYEALGKSGAVHPRIRPMLPNSKLAGVAQTLRILSDETAGVLALIEEAPAGSVLVIDCGDIGVSAVWGGTSSLASTINKLAGCVTNGLVRDFDEMLELGFPVYACGVSVSGTLKNHPGWRGLPISMGGVVVNTGDILIGDSDGVVVIPSSLAESTIEKAYAQRAKEEIRDARIRSGEPITKVLGLR